MLELVPITLKEANAFVERYHRHHKPVVGHKFSIAASDGEKIVGVAIVGRPVSRYCSSNTEAVQNAGEVGEADSDSKGIYRHAGEFRPPAHYRGQSRGLRRVSGSVQTVCRP